MRRSTTRRRASSARRWPRSCPTASTSSSTTWAASSWKPGFSTDYDAVLLAERFQADTLLNLSNIVKVYTADPKTDPDARPLDSIGWQDFQKLVGDTWKPGINVPFDPVATEKAARLKLRVIVAGGRNIDNLKKILYDEKFEGTVIGPD